MSTGNPSVKGRCDGRLPDGRFGPNNKASLENANNRRMQALRKALLDATTPAQVQTVGARLYEQAAAGDVPSARVWLDHVIGKPVQAVEVSGADGEPLGISLHELQAVVLTAVGDDPAARIRVAHALRTLARPGLNGDGGGEKDEDRDGDGMIDD
jgi:hypothetical protein